MSLVLVMFTRHIDRDAVLINPEQVVAVFASGTAGRSYTSITMTSGVTYAVLETLEQVLVKMTGQIAC